MRGDSTWLRLAYRSIEVMSPSSRIRTQRTQKCSILTILSRRRLKIDLGIGRDVMEIEHSFRETRVCRSNPPTRLMSVHLNTPLSTGPFLRLDTRPKILASMPQLSKPWTMLGTAHSYQVRHPKMTLQRTVGGALFFSSPT